MTVGIFNTRDAAANAVALAGFPHLHDDFGRSGDEDFGSRLYYSRAPDAPTNEHGWPLEIATISLVTGRWHVAYLGVKKTLPDALRAPITDLESAKAWLKALEEADLSFHLEDDPSDIILLRSGEPIFDPADVPLIRERVDSLYALDWGPFECPIGYLLFLEEFNDVAP